MGRRRGKTGFDALAALPWPVGVMAGIAGFLAMRDGHPLVVLPPRQCAVAGHRPAIRRRIRSPGMDPFAALLDRGARLVLKARHRRRLLDTRTTLESLAAGGWRQFELLVGEAFRRQGYAVEETGLGGADGGIDLILRKDGRRTLVQCKH